MIQEYRIHAYNSDKDNTYYNEIGELHRKGSPAQFINETEIKYWFINGYLHRLDGPAGEWDDREVHYYLLNIIISKEAFNNWELRIRKVYNAISLKIYDDIGFK